MSALQGAGGQSCSRLFKVTCTFVCPQVVVIDDSGASTHLYRIAQEACNNAIKHGQAASVTIALERQDSKLRRGSRRTTAWALCPVRDSGGMGMQIMRYRAAMIGGTFSIESRPDGGTV